MSVILTGMDMPKSCSDCPMCHSKGGNDPWNFCCFATMDDINIEEWDTERYITCPLQSERTGHWIRITNGAMKEKYICSECGRQIEDDGIEGLLSIKYPYCHCGARMGSVE